MPPKKKKVIQPKVNDDDPPIVALRHDLDEHNGKVDLNWTAEELFENRNDLSMYGGPRFDKFSSYWANLRKKYRK
jgi:hypothetical protein